MTYSDRFDAAILLALDAFRPMRRKASAAPYITHLFAVTALVGQHGGDEDQLIAAMLHDYLEDIPGASVQELERRFGPRVARLVSALSDSIGQPRPPWRQRKERFLARIRSEPDDVKLICAADKLHNVCTIVDDQHRVGNAVFQRFTGGLEGTLWYYGAVLDALGDGWESPLLRRLRAEVHTMRTLAARETP